MMKKRIEEVFGAIFTNEKQLNFKYLAFVLWLANFVGLLVYVFIIKIFLLDRNLPSLNRFLDDVLLLAFIFLLECLIIKMISAFVEYYISKNVYRYSWIFLLLQVVATFVIYTSSRYNLLKSFILIWWYYEIFFWIITLPVLSTFIIAFYSEYKQLHPATIEDILDDTYES